MGGQCGDGTEKQNETTLQNIEPGTYVEYTGLYPPVFPRPKATKRKTKVTLKKEKVVSKTKKKSPKKSTKVSKIDY